MRTVDRSERIRTYNYPENRISDHRTGYKAYNLDQVLGGDLEPVIASSVDADLAARLDAIGELRRAGWSPRPPPSSPRAGVASPEYDAASPARPTCSARPGRPCSSVPERAGRPGRRVTTTWSGAGPAREPLQHLTGTTGFRHVDLAVGPGVFVPRPETELLAGWAVEQAAALDAPVVVDLCTGSGAIALSVAHEVPAATVHAVELDPGGGTPGPSATWPAPGVRLTLGDMADALPELDGTVDVVVCNPPYIPLDAWESVALEARDHDPAAALWSGDDGLDALRVLEADRGPAAAARGSGRRRARRRPGRAPRPPSSRPPGAGADVRDHRDLAGRDRYLTARLSGRLAR